MNVVVMGNNVVGVCFMPRGAVKKIFFFFIYIIILGGLSYFLFFGCGLH